MRRSPRGRTTGRRRARGGTAARAARCHRPAPAEAGGGRRDPKGPRPEPAAAARWRSTFAGSASVARSSRRPRGRSTSAASEAWTTQRRPLDPRHEERAPRRAQRVEPLPIGGDGEGLRAPRGEPVERARGRLLLRPGLAGHQHRRLERSLALERRERRPPTVGPAEQRRRDLRARQTQPHLLEPSFALPPRAEARTQQRDPALRDRPPQEVVGARRPSRARRPPGATPSIRA